MSMYTHHQITKNLDLWVAKTPHKDIVTIMGSMPVPAWRSYSSLELDLWANLLDKGTEKHDKIAIARAIESLGAQLSFSFSQGFLFWTAQCLKADVKTLYPWIQEMLFSSVFPEEEIQLWLKLSASETREELSEPSVQVGIAFTRVMYPEGHPMRQETSKEDLLWLEGSSPSDVRARISGIATASMQIVVVGDIDEADHLGALSSWSFSALAEVEPPMIPDLNVTVALREHIEISDKTSLDVRLGQSLSMDFHHEDYWPLLIAVDALGGTFSARLMQTVRDVEGLTYGVNSQLHNLLPGYGGHFSVVITLAPVNLEKGIASTLFQIRKWWDEGLSEKELAARKQGLLGRHAVRSTKTTQIAMLVRHGLIHGFGANFSEIYAKEIEKVTLEQVNKAIRKWLSPDSLAIISAGTV